MDIESLKGKKISDVITHETEVVKVSDHIAKEIGRGLKLSDQLGIQKHEDLAVISDYNNDLIVCFRDSKIVVNGEAYNYAVAIFYVYEPRYISLYGERNLVVATGNGNIHLYWFDNGKYTEDWY